MIGSKYFYLYVRFSNVSNIQGLCVFAVNISKRSSEICFLDSISLMKKILDEKKMQASTNKVSANKAEMTVQQTSVDHLLLSSTGNSVGFEVLVLNIFESK